MTWVYNEQIAYVLQLLAQTFDLITGSFLDLFNIGTKTFTEYLPIFDTILPLLKALGFGLAMVILLIGLFKNLFVAVTDTYEEPYKLIGRFFLSMFLVYNGTKFIKMQFNFFNIFYKKLLEGTMRYDIIKSATATEKVSIFAKLAGNTTKNLSAGASVVDSIGDMGSFTMTAMGLPSPAVLLTIILIIIIAMEFFKLLLEAAERYVVINLSMIFTPLVASTVTSKSTSRVFTSFFRMVASQLLLMIFNILFIRGSLYMMKHLGEDSTASAQIVLYCIFLIAFLKAGQAMDSYMKSIGLDVVQTGGSLADDILMTGRMLGSGVSGVARGIDKLRNGAFGAGALLGASKLGITPTPRGEAVLAMADKKMQEAGVLRTMQTLASGGDPTKKAMADLFASKGIAGAVHGENAKKVISGMSDELSKMVPGLSSLNADHFSMENGKAMINLGGKKAMQIQDTMPIGKPFQAIRLANGKEAYVTNTGASGVFSSANARGTSKSFSDTYGAYAAKTASAVAGSTATGKSLAGLSEASLSNLSAYSGMDVSDGRVIFHEDGTASILDAAGNEKTMAASFVSTGLGNNVEAVDGVLYGDNGEELARMNLGSIVMQGSESSLEAGKLIGDGNLIDSNYFFASGDMPNTCSDFTNSYVSLEDGTRLNADAIASSDLGSAEGAGNEIVDIYSNGFAEDGSVAITYSNGNTHTFTKESLEATVGDSLYDVDDLAEEHHSFSEFLGRDALDRLKNKMYGENAENVDVIGYGMAEEAESGDVFRVKLSRGSSIDFYPASRYEGSSNAHLVEAKDGSSWWAVESRPGANGTYKTRGIYRREDASRKRF